MQPIFTFIVLKLALEVLVASLALWLWPRIFGGISAQNNYDFVATIALLAYGAIVTGYLPFAVFVSILMRAWKRAWLHNYGYLTICLTSILFVGFAYAFAGSGRLTTPVALAVFIVNGLLMISVYTLRKRVW